MFLVVGATGRVGGTVVRDLIAAGRPVRALARTPEGAALLEDAGAQAVIGDLSQVTALEAALIGVDKVFVVTVDRAILEQHRLFEAAARASVRHIVLMTAMGLSADTPVLFDRWHWEAQQQLERSGVPYTYVQPNFFMQNLFHYGASGTIALPMRDAAVSLVDMRDIAAVAVAALTSNGHEGKAYEISGPQALTFTEVASILTEVTGREFSYRPVEREEFSRAAQAWGVPREMADAVATLYDRIGRGAPPYGSVHDTVPRLTGHPARSLHAFAAEFPPPTWNP